MTRWHSRIPASVLHDPALTAAQVRVMAQVCMYARDGQTTIGVRQLQAGTRHGRATVVLALRRLVERGHLTVIHRGCGQRASTYRIEYLAVQSVNRYTRISGSVAEGLAVQSVNHSQSVTGPGGAGVPECEHGAPAGASCIECRGWRTA